MNKIASLVAVVMLALICSACDETSGEASGSQKNGGDTVAQADPTSEVPRLPDEALAAIQTELEDYYDSAVNDPLPIPQWQVISAHKMALQHLRAWSMTAEEGWCVVIYPPYEVAITHSPGGEYIISHFFVEKFGLLWKADAADGKFKPEEHFLERGCANWNAEPPITTTEPSSVDIDQYDLDEPEVAGESAQLTVVPNIVMDGVTTGDVPPMQAEIIYVNGITTTYEQHLETLPDIAEAFDNPKVMGIYNATGGSIVPIPALVDATQAIDDVWRGMTGIRLTRENAAVNTLYWQIRDVHRGSPLILVGHSQGSAIIASALKLLKEEGVDLSNLTVYTFANVAASYPEGPTYRHCVHNGDIVQRFPEYPIFEAQTELLPSTTLLEIEGLFPDDGTWATLVANHLLEYYLFNFSEDKCPK